MCLAFGPFVLVTIDLDGHHKNQDTIGTIAGEVDSPIALKCFVDEDPEITFRSLAHLIGVAGGTRGSVGKTLESMSA